MVNRRSIPHVTRIVPLFIAATMIAVNVPAWGTTGPPAPGVPTATREIELPKAKADALYTLLAPELVKVSVSPRSEGVQVSGTTREVNAVVAFAGLLTRDEGKDYMVDQAALEALRQTWDSQHTYPLPRVRADALFAALSFSDVPVMVSPAPGGVTVEASAKDHEVIRDFVRILRGETLEDDTESDAATEGAATEGAAADQPQPGHGQAPGARRLAALERRLAELEQRLAALEMGRPPAPRRGLPYPPSPPGVEGPPPPAQPGEPDIGEMIDRSYRLPAKHVERLYALFAPAEITDVIVSREGNQLRIRATAKDHETIERLVELLNRGRTRATASAPAADSGN